MVPTEADPRGECLAVPGIGESPEGVIRRQTNWSAAPCCRGLTQRPKTGSLPRICLGATRPAAVGFVRRRRDDPGIAGGRRFACAADAMCHGVDCDHWCVAWRAAAVPDEVGIFGPCFAETVDDPRALRTLGEAALARLRGRAPRGVWRWGGVRGQLPGADKVRLLRCGCHTSRLSQSGDRLVDRTVHSGQSSRAGARLRRLLPLAADCHHRQPRREP